MKKLKAYLDTSVINFLFADDAPEKKDVTTELFNYVITEGRIDVYISDVVIKEINNTKDADKREKLLNVINQYNFSVLNITEEVTNLADIYLSQNILPQKNIDDATHIAVATVYQCDLLLSWNYKHLANINKEQKITVINLQEGYKYNLRLTTPMEVIGK